MISQKELDQLATLSARKSILSKEIREIEGIEKGIKENLFKRLKQNEPQEEGNYFAEIVAGARRPKWKEEFIKRLGEDEAEKVTNNTPFSETIKVSVHV